MTISRSSPSLQKIAPIVITVFVVVYYVAYFSIIMAMLPLPLKILLGIFPLVFAGVMIYVCIERLKEIDEGEEDSLSPFP